MPARSEFARSAYQGGRGRTARGHSPLASTLARRPRGDGSTPPAALSCLVSEEFFLTVAKLARAVEINLKLARVSTSPLPSTRDACVSDPTKFSSEPKIARSRVSAPARGGRAGLARTRGPALVEPPPPPVVSRSHSPGRRRRRLVTGCRLGAAQWSDAFPWLPLCGAAQKIGQGEHSSRKAPQVI